jgi:hypothetical protein
VLHSNNLIMSIWLVFLLIVLVVKILSGGFFNMVLFLSISSLLPSSLLDVKSESFHMEDGK